MRRLRAQVRKLRRQSEEQLRKRGSMNSGSLISVDYFALSDLLDYFDQTQEAAVCTIRAREALREVFFSLDWGSK